MNIFKDNDKMIENSRESARALGFDVPKTVKKMVHVAKKNCKTCYGAGVVTVSFPGNRGDTRSHRIFCGCVSQKEIEVPVVSDSD